jgi:DNA replication protein DnaC
MNRFRKKAAAIIAGVPDEYLNYSLKSYPGSAKLLKHERVREAKSWINNYLKNMEVNLRDNIGLMIMGPYGTGKTALLSLCLRKALWHVFPDQGIYCTASDMLISVGMGKYDTRTPLYTLADFKKRSVIFIDDLGKEFSVGTTGVIADRGRFGMVLDEVLRTRAAKGLLTYMSTNYTLKEIGEEYGQSCVEAVKQSMVVISFKDDYPNLRDVSDNSAQARMERVYREDQ